MESGSATNGDIAQAILSLSRDEECDIIKLELGCGLVHSEIEADRINSAPALSSKNRPPGISESCGATEGIGRALASLTSRIARLPCTSAN